MARSDYTPPTFIDVPNPVSPPNGAIPLDAAHVNALAQAVSNSARQVAYDVRDYGAKGNGTTDDTVAFQAAINAAAAVHGTVAVPNPASSYKLTSTVTIKPQGSDSQTWLNLIGGGKNGAIKWAGPANTPVFQCLGWKRGGADNIRIDVSGAAGAIAWDVDTTDPYPSTSGVSWTRCFVELGATAGVGWRLGHLSGGMGDLSFLEWRNCTVNGNAAGVTTGSKGWLNEGGNTLNNYWFGGSAAYLDKAVTNNGAGSTGDDSMFFYGFGGTHNLTDFTFASPGAYLISGGRFENGSRFLDVIAASNHPAVTVQGLNLSAYTPSDGILVYFGRPGTLVWDGCFIKSASGTYTAAAFTFDGFTGIGSFFMRGGAIQAVDPFYTFSNPVQPWIQGVGLLNSSQQTVTRAANRLGS